MQIRYNLPDISYLSETQKNIFQFLIDCPSAENEMSLVKLETYAYNLGAYDSEAEP